MGQSRISTHLGLLQDCGAACNRGAKASGRFTSSIRRRIGRASEFIQLAIRGAKELPEHAATRSISSASWRAATNRRRCISTRWPGDLTASTGRAVRGRRSGICCCGSCRRWSWRTLGAGEGLVERTAGAPVQKGHRRGQFGKNGRVRRGQGEEERPEEPGIPPGRFGKPADRTGQR